MKQEDDMLTVIAMNATVSAQVDQVQNAVDTSVESNDTHLDTVDVANISSIVRAVCDAQPAAIDMDS
jgi:hypothetical protein